MKSSGHLVLRALPLPGTPTVLGLTAVPNSISSNGFAVPLAQHPTSYLFDIIYAMQGIEHTYGSQKDMPQCPVFPSTMYIYWNKHRLTGIAKLLHTYLTGPNTVL